MDNNSREILPDKAYPDESTLSETYRRLEGFDTFDDSAQASSRLTIPDFLKKTLKPSDDAQTIDVSDLCTCLGVLLVGGLTLGFAFNQFLATVKQMTQDLPYYPPTKMVWPRTYP